jgi:hypothetical protein
MLNSGEFSEIELVEGASRQPLLPLTNQRPPHHLSPVIALASNSFHFSLVHSNPAELDHL